VRVDGSAPKIILLSAGQARPGARRDARIGREAKIWRLASHVLPNPDFWEASGLIAYANSLI
jgi:hypothetical protein